MAAVHVNQQKEKTMKTEFERYMESGILGDYVPERVLKHEEDGKVVPIFRDASCWNTAEGIELHREMIVGGRRFLVRSVFPKNTVTKTPTEQMLHIIDNDLEKNSR
jgi:hypothetical protein